MVHKTDPEKKENYLNEVNICCVVSQCIVQTIFQVGEAISLKTENTFETSADKRDNRGIKKGRGRRGGGRGETTNNNPIDSSQAQNNVAKTTRVN